MLTGISGRIRAGLIEVDGQSRQQNDRVNRDHFLLKKSLDQQIIITLEFSFHGQPPL